MEASITVSSKLPRTGTTIFTVMSRLAAEYNAINLSQGFPDFRVNEELISLVNRYMQMGMNQYAPMIGEPVLRKAIAAKAERQHGITLDSDTEITVTAGATEAIFNSIAALVHEGDEIIILEPAYDCYEPAIRLQKGIVKRVPLRLPEFKVDWDQVRDLITRNTRMIIINTPHNPTGTVLSSEDLDSLYSLIADTDIIVLSDEVYEHIIFDELSHASVLAHEGLRSRSIATYSFGKTFHATGWKVGYVIAPPAITEEIRKLHQYVTFSVHAPTQFALAEYLKDENNYLELPEFYQSKRDLFLDLMKDSAFEPVKSSGTYFQLFSYKDISELPDMEMAELLTKKHGVAAIPVSVFYQNEEAHQEQLLRFCFAKTDPTLEKAAEILCKTFPSA